MIITKMAMPRRTRTARPRRRMLALPLLDSMVPALSTLAKTAAKPVRRFAVTYHGNGVAHGYFAPKTEGLAYETTPILTPLEPFRKRITVLSGIDNSDIGSPRR